VPYKEGPATYFGRAPNSTCPFGPAASHFIDQRIPLRTSNYQALIDLAYFRWCHVIRIGDICLLPIGHQAPPDQQAKYPKPK
jgi:hypothetical protein